MLIAGFDVETNGLNPKTDDICEIGAVLWDTNRNTPVQMISEIVSLPHGKIMPPELTKIHGITQDDIDYFGVEIDVTLSRTLQLFQKSEAVFAHNAPFDRSFFEEKIKGPFKNLTWIDSMRDLPTGNGLKLGYLAAEHGFVNPFPHRALFDVLTMLKVVSNYDVEGIIRRSHLPKLTLVALVSYDEKYMAKEAGFYFHATSKTWCKDVTEQEADALRNTFPFKTNIVRR